MLLKEYREKNKDALKESRAKNKDAIKWLRMTHSPHS
jgi:hypothetical protein